MVTQTYISKVHLSIKPQWELQEAMNRKAANTPILGRILSFISAVYLICLKENMHFLLSITKRRCSVWDNYANYCYCDFLSLHILVVFSSSQCLSLLKLNEAKEFCLLVNCELISKCKLFSYDVGPLNRTRCTHVFYLGREIIAHTLTLK